MKTKNIFRMLLVAAALLMGANNVQATETTVWEGKNADYYNGDIQLSYSDFTSKGLAIGQILRVYASDFANSWSININSGWSNSLGFGNWKGDSDGKTIRNTNTDAFDNTNGYFEMTIGEGFNKVQNEGFRLQCSGLYVTKITLYSGGGSSKTTPILSFGEGAQETYNITFGDSFTGPTATCDVSDLEITYESDNRSVADVATYTGEITIYGAGQALITAKTQASDDYNAASASYTINVAKVNYTLSYSASTATAVFGQSWTAPTLNNPSNVTVTYSSTNTGVATIDQSGNVTVVGIGQTTIKANYAGDANHEAKEASYVLIVSAPQPAISFNPNVVNFVFGGTYEAPAVTKTPADASVNYSSSDINIAAIDNNGNVVPVGAGSATITGTLANTNVSATYTLNVTAPTRDGAVWNGAAWLGNYTIDGVGTHPQIPTTNLKSAQVGDIIRFYGKLGPISATDWRCEVHGSPWSNQLGEPSGNDAFANGYFDLPITVDNIGMLDTDNLTLNGYNLTINAVELIPASAPTKQDVTLEFSATTATATMGETFTEPTLTATANNETVTGLNISYSSSNTSVATVASNGDVTLVAAGTTTITASFAGNDSYNPASASYTLTVNAAAPSASDYIDVSIDGNLASYGYRTYVTPQAVDLSGSIGVQAYYATGLNTAGTEVQFTEVTGVCASGVPLLLKAKTSATEYKLLKSTATGTTPSGNKLQPGQGDNVQGSYKYVLTVHSGVVVFAEVNIEGAPVDTEHAYLDLNGSNARGRLTIKLSGESTGIQSLQNDERSLDGAIYNLRGQRVEHPTKGIYIINGKKVAIK